MSGIISFLLGCLILAVLVGIGGAVLNVIWAIGWLLIMGVVALFGWLAKALKGWKHLP